MVDSPARWRGMLSGVQLLIVRGSGAGIARGISGRDLDPCSAST